VLQYADIKKTVSESEIREKIWNLQFVFWNQSYRNYENIETI